MGTIFLIVGMYVGMSVGMSVVMQINCVGGMTWSTRMLNVVFGR